MSALQRLLDRTLPNDDTKQSIKKKQSSRAVRRAKKLAGLRAKALEVELDPVNKDKQKRDKRAKGLKRLQTWNNRQQEIKELEDQIFKLKQVKDSSSSKKLIKHAGLSLSDEEHDTNSKFSGLTPGLAPVDGEDSDSDF